CEGGHIANIRIVYIIYYTGSPGMPRATSPTESDGNNTPTSRSRPGESHRVLDRYLGAIFDQETQGGADFLAKQGKVYQQVIRTFFDIKCDCTFVVWAPPTIFILAFSFSGTFISFCMIIC